MNCGTCGHKNSIKSDFCSECGTPLVKASRTSQDASKHRLGKLGSSTIILFAGILIVLIVSFTGYQLLSKKYSEEAIIDQFKKALVQRDKQALKALIVPSDTRLKINDQSLEALFGLMDKNPSLLKDIELGVQKESLTDEFFFIRKNGSKFLFFDQYAIDTNGYYITLTSSTSPTTIYLNDNEIGVLENKKDKKEFGPVLIGTYTLKGVGENKEDEITVDLAGTKANVHIAFDTGKSEDEQQEQKKKEETVVVYKEVERVQPKPKSYDYLLPQSDYAYLSYEDINHLTKGELRLARNEIFARHGYIFKSKDLQDYFDSQYWYSRNPGYNGALSAVEEYNIDLIKSFE